MAGKIVKERILNNELKYDRCTNTFYCYMKLRKDLIRDGDEKKMNILMGYENNGYVRVLNNTVFTCRRTHIGLGTEDKDGFDALSANPSLDHIGYTPRNSVPDMNPLKDTLKTSHVNGYLQTNVAGHWQIGTSHLPCLCPKRVHTVDFFFVEVEVDTAHGPIKNRL